MTFTADAGDVAAPTLTIDGITQDSVTHIINVQVTYSGIAIGGVGVIAQDPSAVDSNRSAHASTMDMGEDPYGRRRTIDIINDGQPHSIVFPLNPQQIPEIPPWILQPGEHVLVDATMWNTSGEQIRAAALRRFFTIPAPAG
jgi:hypothetical protein